MRLYLKLSRLLKCAPLYLRLSKCLSTRLREGQVSGNAAVPQLEVLNLTQSTKWIATFLRAPERVGDLKVQPAPEKKEKVGNEQSWMPAGGEWGAVGGVAGRRRLGCWWGGRKRRRMVITRSCYRRSCCCSCGGRCCCSCWTSWPASCRPAVGWDGAVSRSARARPSQPVHSLTEKFPVGVLSHIWRVGSDVVECGARRFQWAARHSKFSSKLSASSSSSCEIVRWIWKKKKKKPKNGRDEHGAIAAQL